MDLRVPSDVELVDADVLVVGGGFAGAWAALRAATLSGGVTTAPLDGDDLSAWVEEFVVRGTYMAVPAAGDAAAPHRGDRGDDDRQLRRGRPCLTPNRSRSTLQPATAAASASIR